MADSSVENPSEGWVVLAAGMLMVFVVGGSVSWQTWQGGAGSDPGGGAAPSGLEPEVDRLTEQVSALELKLAEAEAERAFAQEAADRAKQERIEAQAQAEVVLEQRQAQAARLAEENRALKLEVESLLTRNQGLEQQVALLSEAASGLVSGRAREAAAQPTPSGAGPAPVEPSAADAWSGAIRVVDGNASLRYVVLTAGSEAGIRNGMTFTVLEEDRPIADLRADDVREGYTGAVVERVYPGERFPRASDRVVVRKRVE